MSDLMQLEFERVLKNNNQKLTGQRQAIFNLLKNSDPQSLSNMLKNSNNLFDRTSLYRTIDLFIKLGIAERINIGWKYKIELSDKFTHHHHHLTCINCHKIIDIPEESYFEDYINNLAKKNNFAITRHQIEIEGHCQNCKKV